MLLALIEASARHLARDRASLFLTFLLPVAFLSLTALSFGRLESGGPTPARLYAVDLDGSAASRRLLSALANDATLSLQRDPDPCADRPCALARVAGAVDSGRAWAALLVPAGFGTDRGAAALRQLELFAPATERIAAPMVERALASALSADLGPGVTIHRLPVRRAEGSSRAVRGALSGLLVVFLLFTAAGASGWLIEEEQQGTLSLLLTTRAGWARILGAQWLFLVALGGLQGMVMVLWASSVFGLDLGGPARIGRVSLVTIATAGATASVGLLLAASVRTRAQLGAVSTLTILLLAAAGGCFVPRPALPDVLQTVGLGMPTTWAVAGLWSALEPGAPLAAVLPAIFALAGFTAAFLTLAGCIARRRVLL